MIDYLIPAIIALITVGGLLGVGHMLRERPHIKDRKP
jgi:hypothetical protein